MLRILYFIGAVTLLSTAPVAHAQEQTLQPPANNQKEYTNGHVTPLGLGAPPNSWAYEEFTLPNMIEKPVVFFEGKRVVKHGCSAEC